MSTKASDETPFRKQRGAMVLLQVSWSAGVLPNQFYPTYFHLSRKLFFEHSLITRTVLISKELIVMIVITIIIIKIEIY